MIETYQIEVMGWALIAKLLYALIGLIMIIGIVVYNQLDKIIFLLGSEEEDDTKEEN